MVAPNELHLIPETSGVYLMKGEDGEVLYVGKANNLRSRVKSHVQQDPGSGGWYQSFVPLLEEIAYVVTDNDVEALLLEHNLIKEHNPRFNVKLKDDKRYPYIKVTLNEPFPRLFLTRNVQQDKGRYFGPYPHVREARTALTALMEVFPLRKCRLPSEKLKKRERPCLNFEMKKCIGPCSQKVSSEEYDVLVKGVLDFLAGRVKPVIALAEKRMKDHASVQQYEKAAVYRDILRAVEATSAEQRVTESRESSGDFIGIDSTAEIRCVSVLRSRYGKLLGGEFFYLDSWEGSEESEQLRAFLRDFYSLSTDIPDEILIPSQIEDSASLEKWLGSRSGHAVSIHCPQRGRKVRSLELAKQNAHFRSLEKYMKTHGLQDQVEPSVFQLQEILSLSKPPLRIEGYDIANISGKDAVGSMVVFKNGRAAKGFYRRFKIRGLDEPDDYGMMREMLLRRLGHTDEEFGEIPDLIMIDGGKGHLNTALQVLREKNMESLPTIALAKQEEEIYLPNHEFPLVLERSLEALKLLQRIRDEAHRYAQDYHHRLRSRSVRTSALDEIQGVGPARKRALMRRFGSLKKIGEASIEEISSVAGLGPELAKLIKRTLHEP